MESNLGLLGAVGGSGGGAGASSGVSTSEFGSTLSKEDNHLVLASEESSSYPDESEIELGLGLSLGGGGFRSKAVPWSQYGRILTAEDLPSSMVASKSSVNKSPPPSSSASSSSSSSMTKANFSAGTKRTADSISPPPANRGVT